MAWAFLFGLILCEIVADIYAKEFTISSNIQYGVVSITFYVIANISWLISMHHGTKLSVGASIFAVSTAIIAAVIGVLMYGETLEVKQYIGIALGSLAIFFLV